MTLWAHCYSGYASYENAYSWGNDEHSAHKWVQALKGEPINGYAQLKRPNGQWIKITTAQPAGAFQIWGEWAAERVKALLPAGGLLIPIPSSSCLAIGTDKKGKALADAVAQRAPGFDAVDAIHWDQQFAKASKGGPRDEATLYKNIRVLNDLDKRPVILIDDVVTGGGHAIACAKALRWAGHQVEHVVAAAHTVKSPPAKGMFALEPWDLEADPFAGVFG